ncbi:peptide-methionine (S)-S-oxide reductase MsrA [Undibacterium nitidum]|nr:peptide-methionine (S)-S-oxide reductase MsrA [Undibacterium nitidum]
MAIEIATFGAGRFWDVEAVFQHIRGVKSVRPGYAGGHATELSYEDVCSGDTGHAEVVQVQFDNAVVSYVSLLEVFFKIHDPCALTCGEYGHASPHRSLVLYHTTEQKRFAQESIKRISRFCSTPLTTEVLAYQRFYAAEQAHRNFYKNNKKDPYCVEFILPKILLSRELFARKKMAA